VPSISAGAASPAATTPPSSPSTPGIAAVGPFTRTDVDWTTFMGDPQRSGIGPQTPRAGTPHRTWTAPVDGDVYAEPLVAGPSVIVATERNTVYSLDAGSGAVRWQRHLGDPVPLSALECGNIALNGITSTPVVDADAGMVYVVAFFNNPLRHQLVALRVSDGGVVWQRPADAEGADPRIHQQRGALNLSRGRVYFTYGGFTGDCGRYLGRVVSAPTGGTGPLIVYTVEAGQEAGIWAAPGPVISTTGEVWVSTGNTEVFQNDPGQYDGANAVMRLDPTLTRHDQWAPGNWANLNSQDIDLASVAPALLPDGLVFASGKFGFGYILRGDGLGGIGGELYSDQVCRSGGPLGGAFGGIAVLGRVLLVPCVDNLTAVTVDTRSARPSFTVAWRSVTGPGSAILAYGLVWTVASDTTNYRRDWTGSLVGVDPRTGAEQVRLPLGRIPHFAAPAAAGGNLFIAGIGQVYAVSAV